MPAGLRSASVKRHDHEPTANSTRQVTRSRWNLNRTLENEQSAHPPDTTCSLQIGVFKFGPKFGVGNQRDFFRSQVELIFSPSKTFSTEAQAIDALSDKLIQWAKDYVPA